MDKVLIEIKSKHILFDESKSKLYLINQMDKVIKRFQKDFKANDIAIISGISAMYGDSQEINEYTYFFLSENEIFYSTDLEKIYEIIGVLYYYSQKWKLELGIFSGKEYFKKRK